MLNIFKKPEEYDREWDERLNEIMDNHAIRRADIYDCSFEGLPEDSAIWIWNYPYAFGMPSRPVRVDIHPSLETRKRLKKMVDDYLYDNGLSEDAKLCKAWGVRCRQS